MIKPMKYINVYAYFAQNLGDDLMVDILVKNFPKYRFYTERDVKNPWLLENRNFRSKGYYETKYERLGSFIDKITGKKKGTFVKNKIQKVENNRICSVLIGGSVFMQRASRTDEQVHARLRRNDSYLNYGPLFVIGSNFGAYSTEYFKSSFEAHFRKCKGVSFRDKASYGMFEHLPNVQYAPDVVFALDYLPKGSENTGEILISVIDITEKYGMANYAEKYESFLADFCRYVISLNKIPVLMSFCKSEGDEAAIERILGILGDSADKTKTCFYRGDMEEALRQIADAEFVLASRFHAMVLALQMKKRFFALSYDMKISNVLSDIGSDLYCDVSELGSITPEEIFNKAAEVISVADYGSGAKKHFEQLEKFLKDKK